MINRVVLVGRLTKDIELRYTPNGVAVANFTLAVNRTFTNAQGEREADFINVVTFKKTAENAANYLSKGSLAGIDGRIQTRNYENNEGKRVYVTEVMADSVQFLDSRSSQNGQGGAQSNNSNNPPNGEQNRSFGNGGSTGTQYNSRRNDSFSNPGGPIDISDDDLPF